MMILKRQVRELDKIPRMVFLQKVETFILDHADSYDLQGINLKSFVQEKHIEAGTRGKKSERDIVSYIIAQLPTKTVSES